MAQELVSFYFFCYSFFLFSISSMAFCFGWSIITTYIIGINRGMIFWKKKKIKKKK